ncbi:hypothetical protein [Pseudarthrobacter oxydans]|uniref:hypothetical protein n=1 Tax=Pseudarthrobacter oxydans TaxID=1671 RepID=UPI00344B0392
MLTGPVPASHADAGGAFTGWEQPENPGRKAMALDPLIVDFDATLVRADSACASRTFLRHLSS